MLIQPMLTVGSSMLKFSEENILSEKLTILTLFRAQSFSIIVVSAIIFG